MKPEENTNWEYKPGDGGAESSGYSPALQTESSSKTIAHPLPTISWEAPEFIKHERSPLWYPALFLGVAGISTAVYFVTKDYFTIGTVVIIGVIIAVAAARKPRQINCEISPTGITIGQKSYGFSQFKSFGVIREGNLSYVELFPIKRFMPPVSSYFTDSDEQKITSAIGQHLPYEERKMAGVERLSHKLHF